MLGGELQRLLCPRFRFAHVLASARELGAQQVHEPHEIVQHRAGETRLRLVEQRRGPTSLVERQGNLGSRAAEPERRGAHRPRRRLLPELPKSVVEPALDERHDRAQPGHGGGEGTRGQVALHRGDGPPGERCVLGPECDQADLGRDAELA